MAEREKVVNNLGDLHNIMLCKEEICPREELNYWIELQESIAEAIVMLNEQPKIVRCTDCVHQCYDLKDGRIVCGNVDDGEIHPADWFCADGERY